MTKTVFSRLLTPLLIALSALLAAQAPAAQPAADDASTSPTATFDFPAAGTTRVINNAGVAAMLANHGSDLLVVNFWATWCGPCVEELPYFVKVSREFEDKGVRFVGISIDFHDEVETRVIPFLREKKIPYSNVVFFGQSEELINVLAPEWKGDLPATFLYDRSGRQVGKFLRPVTEAELRGEVARLRGAAGGTATE